MKGKGRGLIIAGGIVAILVLMVFSAIAGMGEIRKLSINDVDLSRLADGVYTGSFHKARWSYNVEVTVVGHKIAAVKNTNNKTNKIKDFNDKIAAAILVKQSPKVDVVSGATLNTKAFGKAVENALNTGFAK